jgi:hypothetical protein
MLLPEHFVKLSLTAKGDHERLSELSSLLAWDPIKPIISLDFSVLITSVSAEESKLSSVAVE